MIDETTKEVQDEEFLEEDTQKDLYMTFVTAGESYAIAIRYVNEIISFQKITDIPDTENCVKGLINLRGKIIPVIDVRIRFGYDSFEYTDRTCIIITELKGYVVGLIVEKIEGVVSIPKEDILPPPEIGQLEGLADRYIYGIGKIEDDVKLMIDIDKLLKDPEDEEEDNMPVEETEDEQE